MERIKRNPEKFEVIDLFTAMGREHGYKLRADEDTDDFIERIRNSLKASQENPNILYGKRVESLFAHIAAALGKCVLIKQEDSGEAFSSEQNIQAPDYKVILKDGRQYFIEVKNCHFPNVKSPYPFNKEYIQKLERYAEIHSMPLLFAIYFSQHNKWFLLSKSSLIEQKKRYVIDFITAMAKNEMSLLGDRMIGTEPNLTIELSADSSKKIAVNNDGQTHFIIGGVKLYSAERELFEDMEKKTAFYFMRFGNWEEQDSESIYKEGEFKGVRFTYSPHSQPEEQSFSIIGDLSSMISSSYAEQTIYERSIIALDTNLAPTVFSVQIPDDYKGTNLPLWQFIIQPNSEFESQPHIVKNT